MDMGETGSKVARIMHQCGGGGGGGKGPPFFGKKGKKNLSKKERTRF